MSLYNIAQPVGAMMSGAMQGALATNLNGSLGRAGWRWAFLINVSLISQTVRRVETNFDLLGCLHHIRCTDSLYCPSWLRM